VSLKLSIFKFEMVNKYYQNQLKDADALQLWFTVEIFRIVID